MRSGLGVVGRWIVNWTRTGGLIAGLWVAGACGGDDGSGTPASQTVIRPTNVTFAQSPDAVLNIQILPGAFDAETTLTIREVDQSPVGPNATLSPAYELTAGSEPSGALSATLNFALSDATLALAGGVQNVRIARGETPGQMWTELLEGSYDAEKQIYSLQITGFSYYMLIDQAYLERCGCDTDSSCQAGCQLCDRDCSLAGTSGVGEQPAAGEAAAGTGAAGVPCDPQCLAQPGAICCMACGCTATVRCDPVCPAPAVWSCESNCCFSNETFACLP